MTIFLNIILIILITLSIISFLVLLLAIGAIIFKRNTDIKFVDMIRLIINFLFAVSLSVYIYGLNK